jgi:two-component system OmpR family response regulator
MSVIAMHDHVLIVDEDAGTRSLLQAYLHKRGFRVTTTADGEGLRRALDSARPDLVVLDPMLPGADGLELCRDLRTRSSVPIIMLTARGGDADRIAGLDMGADDYLSKPFNPRELVARIKSVLRRARRLPVNLEPETVKSYCFAGWTLDLATRTLTTPEGDVEPLSRTEFKLLRVFLAHPDRVLTRDQLIELMTSGDAGPFDRAIDVQVSRLRQRLREDAREPRIIKTRRAAGYVFAVNLDQEVRLEGAHHRRGPIVSARTQPPETSCIQQAWQAHEAELRGYLRRRMPDRTEADDLLQEVFLKALRQGRAFCELEQVRAWLFQVARNSLADRLRLRREEVDLPEDLPAETHERPAVETLDQCLPRVLSELAAEDREALVLCDLEGLPQAEYARRKGIALPAAKSRVQRARKRLRARMTEACRVALNEGGQVESFVPRVPPG